MQISFICSSCLANIMTFCDELAFHRRGLCVSGWSVILPQDTPGHPKIPQDAFFPYLIHLFIHSDKNKAKMASNSFHFKCIYLQKGPTKHC